MDISHAEWLEGLTEGLANSGEDGLAAAQYLRAHGTKVNFKRTRPAVGAFWTITGGIRLNTHYYSYDTPLTDPYMLSLIAHEARHLEQGILTALSVYGELEAWQIGMRVYHDLAGAYPQHAAIEEIMALPLSWDRAVLRQARALMQAYSGKGYRADLLPLYPLPAEIRHCLTGWQPDYSS